MAFDRRVCARPDARRTGSSHVASSPTSLSDLSIVAMQHTMHGAARQGTARPEKADDELALEAAFKSNRE